MAKIVKYVGFGVMAAGAGVILWRTRSTSKFRNANDIPQQFVDKNYRLQGLVKDVTEDGRLVVDHIPILKLRDHLRFITQSVPAKEDKHLELRLAGLTSNPEATEWLHKNVAKHRHVWFTLLDNDGDELDCHVHVKKKYLWSSVNKDLVKLGLSTVRHFDSLPDSEAYNKLLHKLIALESKASKKGVGMWKEEGFASRMKTQLADQSVQFQSSIETKIQEGKTKITENLKKPFIKIQEGKTKLTESLKKPFSKKENDALEGENTKEGVDMEKGENMASIMKTKIQEGKTKFTENVKKTFTKNKNDALEGENTKEEVDMGKGENMASHMKTKIQEGKTRLTENLKKTLSKNKNDALEGENTKDEVDIGKGENMVSRMKTKITGTLKNTFRKKDPPSESKD